MSAAEMEEVDSDEFDLRPPVEEANGAAALCLHGLTGTPYEVRSIAEALVARGVRARGPWMAGHEEGAEELAKTSWQAWLEGARRELAALRAEHDRVFLVGMSMGGLVSLRIAETEEIDAFRLGRRRAVPIFASQWHVRATRVCPPCRFPRLPS